MKKEGGGETKKGEVVCFNKLVTKFYCSTFKLFFMQLNFLTFPFLNISIFSRRNKLQEKK